MPSTLCAPADTGRRPLHSGKIDETFKDVEMLNFADLVRRPAMFSYIDGDEYVFMDNEDYTPYNLNKDTIADEVLFINEETQGIQVIIVDESPVAIDLPSSVELVIEETDPSIKGASASARTKPAKLSTGLTIQVPEHISTGDKVKVNTEERKFMGRADK
jgi:elongation factor P